MKHATNSEVLLFKRLIEQKLATLLNSSNSTLSNDLFSSLNEEEVVDFEFISNPQAIQTSVKNTFGYVRSRNSSGTNSVGSAHGSLRQQPPISRPTSSNRYVNKRKNYSPETELGNQFKVNSGAEYGTVPQDGQFAALQEIEYYWKFSWF